MNLNSQLPKMLIFVLLVMSIAKVGYCQEEIVETIYQCEGECIKIGIKKKKGYRYEWKAFGMDLKSEKSKIKVCPEKPKNLYYVHVYNKEGKHFQTHNYKINVIKSNITILPKGLCILDRKPLNIEVKEDYKKYKWSNGMKGKKITIDKPQVLFVKVEDDKGCKFEKKIEIVERDSNEIKKKLEKSGFYGVPIQTGGKKKKKGKN